MNLPLEPSHPDEPGLHHALRDALNRGLSNTDFFVWITVHPTGERKDFADLSGLVRQADEWLRQYNAETVDPSQLPEREFSDRAATVEVKAIPKKPAARGRHPGEIVGNPEPILTGWLD